LRAGSVARKKTDSFDFEAALASLEELVSSMEEGNLSLEDSLKAFEQGIRLTRECQNALQQAEQKVQKLINDNGETAPLALDGEDHDA